jgi:hypothetical protein
LPSSFLVKTFPDLPFDEDNCHHIINLLHLLADIPMRELVIGPSTLLTFFGVVSNNVAAAASHIYPAR